MSDAFARFGLPEPDQPDDGPPIGYKTVELSIPACALLLNKLTLITVFGKDRELIEEIKRAVELGAYYELPLEDPLPWLDVTTAATQQGVDEADVLFDRMGRHREPPVRRRRPDSWG